MGGRVVDPLPAVQPLVAHPREPAVTLLRPAVRRARPGVAVALLVTGAVLLGGCSAVEGGRGTPAHSARPTSPPDAEPAGGEVRATLAAAIAALPVARERRRGYDRDLFEHWVDADGNGCDTREEVLLVENRSPEARLGDDCALVDGRWRSYYDDVTTSDDAVFDVDHLVPLAEAWDSGAWAWSAARRRAYANDLGERRSLVGVSASSNRGKADDDPAQWLPTYGTCVYVSSWTAVKVRWSLSVDPREQDVLAELAGDCGQRRLSVDLARVVGGPAARTADERHSIEGRYPVAPGPAVAPPRQPARRGTDRRYPFCTDAVAAGLGPYVDGRDREYAWYADSDADGTVCE